MPWWIALFETLHRAVSCAADTYLGSKALGVLELRVCSILFEGMGYVLIHDKNTNVYSPRSLSFSKREVFLKMTFADEFSLSGLVVS